MLETDVTDQSQAQHMVERTVGEFGRLDTLVNNAGRDAARADRRRAPVENGSGWSSSTCSGSSYCTHAALPHLLRAAEGEPRGVADVVNVSSVAGRVARQGSGVYNATKFGVVAFTESLRQEVTRRHVRASVVEPGAVMTELASAQPSRNHRGHASDVRPDGD